jgi:uncharacterized integral membrane protein
MMLSIITTFFMLLIIIIAIVQNSEPVTLAFFSWKVQLSQAELIIYSAVIGGAIVAVLTLPKLVSKSLKVRSLRKELFNLKKKGLEMEKRADEEKSQ